MFSEQEEEVEQKQRWPTCFWTQYKMLVWRMFKQSKSRILGFHPVLSAVLLSVIVGIIYFQSPRTAESVRDRMGLLFFGIGHMGYITVFDSVLSFSEERAIVSKERQAGTYRILALYLAKLTSELPLTFTLPLTYHTVSYWMAGLRPDATIFLASFGIMMLHILNCKGIGFMIGPAIWNWKLAFSVTSTSLASLLMVGGFYIPMFPSWLMWTRYLSVFGHTLSAMLILELSDLPPISCVNVTVDTYPQCGMNGTDFVTGDNTLNQLGTVLPIYMYLLALTIMVVVYFIAGYAIFRIRGKPKS